MRRAVMPSRQPVSEIQGCVTVHQFGLNGGGQASGFVH